MTLSQGLKRGTSSNELARLLEPGHADLYERAAQASALSPDRKRHRGPHPLAAGDALFADTIATKCARLYLSDAAPLVRERLNDRFRGNGRITVLSTDDV